MNDLEMEEMATFDRGNNLVEVNMARHSSPNEVASSIVHEGTHQFRFYKTGNVANNQYEEYLAFRNEAWFKMGERPSLTQRQGIWEYVQDLYSHLPQGKNPFGGGQ